MRLLPGVAGRAAWARAASLIGGLDVVGGVRARIVAIDHDVDTVEVAECQELARRERRGAQTASSHDHDLTNIAVRQRIQGMLGDVGVGQLDCGHQQDARASSATLPLPTMTARSPDRSKARSA